MPCVTAPVLLCTDGSELAAAALAAGLDVLGDDGPFVVVTAIPAPDPMLVTGTGFAGGTMTQEEYDAADKARLAEADALTGATAHELGLDDAGTRVVRGDPGPAICQLAEELSARAIVVGTRGRSGVKRAVLGSVSDHIVRNAPCPVVVTGPAAERA